MDLRDTLRAAAGELPPLPDRHVQVDLQLGDAPASIHGDPARLKHALASVLSALRRELVTTDTMVVRQRAATHKARPVEEIVIGDPGTIAAVDAADPAALPLFDEWRGGSGLILPVARRVLDAHDGRIWGAPDGRKAGAKIVLPSAVAAAS